jgi:hypothetical protein
MLMKELENNDNSIGGNIRHISNIQEKLRVAQVMLKRGKYPSHVAYVVELPYIVIEKTRRRSRKMQ